LPVRSSSSASSGCVSVTLISRLGYRFARVASAAGTSDPFAEAKAPSRTRPAFSRTWAELGSGAVDAADDLGGAVGEQLPGRGEPDPSADPLQQLSAGLGLEPGEVMGDRRLGVVQLLRRRGHRSVAGDGVDDPQPVHVQHASTLSMKLQGSWHWTYETDERKLKA
jgi:hypothetical protein